METSPSSRKRKRDSDHDNDVEINKTPATKSAMTTRKRKRERDHDDVEINMTPAKRNAMTTRKRKRERDDDDMEIIDRPAKKSAITLADFTIHCQLGEGVYGKVFLVSARGADRMMAMKIVPKTPILNSFPLRESRVLQAARDSPFLVDAYAAFLTKEDAYFITEYLPGGTLHDLIDTCKYLDEDKARFYTAEIVCGLQYLHQRGIAHSDIKPDNIMLDKEGHIKIIDMGLAQDGLNGSEATTGSDGNLYFMAPEDALPESNVIERDWWDLGKTVSEMLTGRSPFNYLHYIYKPNQSDKEKELCFPAWLSDVSQDFIRKLLDKNRKQRLGVTGDIRAHAFFHGIDWKALEERRVEPPVRPFL